MTPEELEKLRIDDIDFFAKRYAELFAKHFDITTPEQRQSFYAQIKEDLYKNAPIYVVDNDSLSPFATAQSTYNKIILSNNSVNDKKVRIHELVHSYNIIKYQLHGLRDIENGFVLKNLDEGTTELIAQLMMGNEYLKDTNYVDEVELANFITHLVGEKIMIQATRGNPQLLSAEVDKLLGTTDFLRSLETMQSEYDKLVTESFGQDAFWGTDISKERQILSQLKIESLRGKDALSVLYDAVKKTGDQALITKFNQTDDKYGYNFVFRKMISKEITLDPNKPTLASVQQEQLKNELNRLANSNHTPLDELKIELTKFLYDKIDFQKYFIDRKNYTYGAYDLTPEDMIYCYKFKSSLDGQNVRLGGKFGVEGIANKVNELDNTPFLINREHVDKMFIEGVGFDELLDCRLEFMAEKLTIAQSKEILKEWSLYIKNTFLAERFPNAFPETFDLTIETLKHELEKREKELINKYKQTATQAFDDTTPQIQNNNEQQKIVSRPRISGKIRQTVYTRDVLTPHINDTLRTDGEIVMEEEFGKEMQNAQQSTFNKPHISTKTKRKVEERDLRLQDVYKSNAKNKSQISGKTEKAKLEEQRRDLRRIQFGEKSSSTVVNTQKVPNLNDVLRQQQIIQQQQQMKMEDELDQDHGMSM